MLTKRLFDLLFTIPGLLILLPVFFIISIWVKMDSKGPIFFKQQRVGKNGTNFNIFKFRTMVVNAEKLGKQITIGNDQRVTSAGIFLRKYKLDELPQLFNVLLGEMSLVGPRPEVPYYVKEYPENIRTRILSVPPGITDYASIEYKDENLILAKAQDPEKAYIEEVLPIKLQYYLKYVDNQSIPVDLKLIFKTIISLIR